jgi:hypothetical protein
MDWANESFAIAEQARTEYCIRQGASCDQPSGKVKIDAAYIAVNAPIVREQLQKAGVGSRICSMLLWAGSDPRWFLADGEDCES